MVVILLSVLLAADQPSDAELLARAEADFAAAIEQRQDPVKSKAHFRASARSFGELHARGIRNSDLYRNQGNAALLADDLAAAILAYRRGLRLSPNDRGLQQCLATAREKVFSSPAGLGHPPVDDRPPWLPRIGLTWWTLALLLAGYCAACVSITRSFMIASRQLAIAGVAILACTALLGLSLWYADRQEQLDREQPLVVIAAPDVPLRLGNGADYPSQYNERLRPGVEARLLFRRGDWRQVRLSGGETGWVHASDVLVDEQD